MIHWYLIRVRGKIFLTGGMDILPDETKLSTARAITRGTNVDW